MDLILGVLLVVIIIIFYFYLFSFFWPTSTKPQAYYYYYELTFKAYKNRHFNLWKEIHADVVLVLYVKKTASLIDFKMHQ